MTTTPRPIDLLKRIAAERWTIATGGRMEMNVVLEDQYRTVVRAAFAGTRLERQELDGVLDEDVEDALWTATLSLSS